MRAETPIRILSEKLFAGLATQRVFFMLFYILCILMDLSFTEAKNPPPIPLIGAPAYEKQSLTVRGVTSQAAMRRGTDDGSLVTLPSQSYVLYMCGRSV